MAHSGFLPPETLADIARQISGDMPAKKMLEAPGAGPALGESLRVAILPLDRLRDGEGALADRVEWNGYWHHQVYSGAEATEFARSKATMAEPGSPHQVVEVVTSDLPDAVRQAIEWADANIEEEGEARLLEVPSHGLTALWIDCEREDIVVVAAKPDRIDDFNVHEPIRESEFLDHLAHAEPILGLGLLGGERNATME